MAEKWTKWEPHNAIYGVVYLENIVYDVRGLRLTFASEDNNRAIVVTFNGFIRSFRCTDEGTYVRTVRYLAEYYGVDFWAKWKFFKVMDSEYLRWHNEESEGVYSEWNLVHYVILSLEDVVEVLAVGEPIVEVKYSM